MRALFLFLSILTLSEGSAQYSLTVLPVELSVTSYTQRLFTRRKKDLFRGTAHTREDSLQWRYRDWATQRIDDMLPEGSTTARFVRSVDAVDDSLALELSRLADLLSVEMNRREEVKKEGLKVTIGGMSRREMKEANAALIRPLAQTFMDYFGCRYFALLKVRGYHSRNAAETSRIFGGIRFQVAILDGQTGEVGYYLSIIDGAQDNPSIMGNSDGLRNRKKIKERNFTLDVESLVSDVLTQHRKLVKKARKRDQ